MTKKLKELLERAETWPKEAQEEATAALLSIEQELTTPYELTDEDKTAIDRGLADAAAGRFATNAQVKAVFAKYRPA
jgi:predicted transcriptional regulator